MKKDEKKVLAGLVDLAASGQYDELMDELEKMPPRMLMRFAHAFAKTGKDPFEDLVDHFSEEQRKRFHWLDSSERARKYFSKIPDEEMTKEDWFDLRATDF